MARESKPFEVEKTFGLGVLLKLTKKNVEGVDIATTGSKFTSSLSLDQVNEAVHKAMEAHNIRIKIK